MDEILGWQRHKTFFDHSIPKLRSKKMKVDKIIKQKSLKDRKENNPNILTLVFNQKC